MPEYVETHHEINGIDTAVLTAGDGPPLVFLHGGGTATGFDALLPLAERTRLIVPIHPGFGASADDPSIDDIRDYVLHYLDALRRAGARRDRAGGPFARGLPRGDAGDPPPSADPQARARIAVRPRGSGHETVSLAHVSPEEVEGYLTDDPLVFAGLPTPPTQEFLDDRAREATVGAARAPAGERTTPSSRAGCTG